MLAYFVAIWKILQPFGNYRGTLVNIVTMWSILWLFGLFFPFWYVEPRKIWQPCGMALLKAPSQTFKDKKIRLPKKRPQMIKYLPLQWWKEKGCQILHCTTYQKYTKQPQITHSKGAIQYIKWS
jgi:hypothetical protein